MKLRRDKKGQVFGQLAGLATGVATLAIVLVVAFLVISEGRDQIETIEGVDCSIHNGSPGSAWQSHSCNATAELQSAVGEIPGWVPLIIIASIGAILLGLVAMFRRG